MKFLIDIDNTTSRSYLEMILENELDCKVYVKEVKPIDEESLNDIAYNEAQCYSIIKSNDWQEGFKEGVNYGRKSF